MSVVVFGICRTLQYHFEIGVNLLLLACANYLQTLGLTRHYWRSWPAALAAFMRLLAVIGIYFCFGWILAIQNSSSDTLRKHQFVAERMPGENKRDSVVFLKAACFLDPGFQNNTFVPLDPGQRTNIGVHENNGQAPEWFFGIMLMVVTGIALITCLVQVFRGPTKTTKRMTVLLAIYYASIWLLSTAVFCYSAATIFGLRSWVSKSGWLQPVERSNPDDSVRGFGQTAALVLLAAMVIAALENASVTVAKTVKPKKASKGKQKKAKLKYEWLKFNIFIRWNAATKEHILVIFDADANSITRKLLTDHLSNTIAAIQPESPHSIYVPLAQLAVQLQEDAVWRIRDAVRAVEKDRTSLYHQFASLDTPFSYLHDLARHAIHVFETLDLTARTLHGMIEYHHRSPTRSATFPAMDEDDSNRLANTSIETSNRDQLASNHLRFYQEVVQALRLRSIANKDRLQNEIQYSFNLAAQTIARSSNKIQGAVHLDSSVIKTVTLAKAAFNPMTFIATLFGMQFFAYSVDSGVWNVSGK
ncbi:MAG: hypothetical protein Q9196_004842, partial [Gyalolechia fulgens]